MSRRPRLARIITAIVACVPVASMHAAMHAAALALVGIVVHGPALGAQWRAEAGLGAARVTQPEAQAAIAANANVDASYEARGAALLGAAAVTAPSRGDVRIHGLVAVSVRTSPERRAGVELSAMGSAYDDGYFPRQLSALASGRVRVRAGPFTLWGGGGGGGFDDGTYSYPLTMIDVGAATSWRGSRLTVTALRTTTLGEPRTEFVDDPPVAVIVRDRVAYTDASVGVHARRGRAEFSVRGGGRIVHRTIAFEDRPPVRLTAGLDAAWWGTPRTAIVVSAGRELADLSRGLPESRFVSLGLKVRLHEPRHRAPVHRIVDHDSLLRVGPRVLIERLAARGAMLRVLGTQAMRKVEVAATFTEWEPIALMAEGNGSWVYDGVLESGPHRLMIRVDGGEWRAPGNLPSVDDGLGGRVGMVTVP